jgi:N-acetyl sugar amidotransferase
MKYCKICLEIDTRPNINFDYSGVCYACNSFDNIQKKYSDNNRIRIFKDLIEKYRSKGNYFDCILGVSGGKDSTRQALWLKEKFNLRPLLVCCSYPPEQITSVGTENLSNLMKLGFDVLVSAPAPQLWKKSVRESFFKGNYLTGPEIALYSSLPQIAIKYKLKLIFWGENPATVWNDQKTNSKEGYNGNNLRHSNTLRGCKIDWMKKIISNKTQLIPYKYPSVKDFKSHQLQIIYLSWFWKNWTFLSNAKYSCLNGLELKKDNATKTGDLYGITAIDDTWVSVNQMIKYFKFGFGRVTDYLNFEIRNGSMSREEAIVYANKYDGKCDQKYINDFCRYIGISKFQFNKSIKKIINKKLFTIESKGKNFKIKKKFIVGEGLKK